MRGASLHTRNSILHAHASSNVLHGTTGTAVQSSGVSDCRVEMTVSRGVLRIVGTVIGGTIGFLIMLHHSLAADPYAHMASPPSHQLTRNHTPFELQIDVMIGGQCMAGPAARHHVQLSAYTQLRSSYIQSKTWKPCRCLGHVVGTYRAGVLGLLHNAHHHSS